MYVCIIRVRPRKYCGGFATIVDSEGTLNWCYTAIQNQPNTTGGIRETSNLVELRFVSGKGGQWGQTERHQGSLAALPIIALGWWAMYGWVDGGRGGVDCRSNTASLWEEESMKGNCDLLIIKILKHSVCREQESS